MQIPENSMGKTLIICEKPSAAAKIAPALAEKKPVKRELNGVPYYEFERDGKRMVVVPALGHLFTLKNLRPMRDYPVFDVDWVPSYQVDPKAKRTKAFIDAIRELAKDATEYVVASVDGNELTPVMVDGHMKLVHIGSFIDEIYRSGKIPRGIRIPCVDWQTGEILFKPLKGVSRHVINEPLYEVILPYGRQVKITSSHSVFALENGRVRLVKGSEIRKGTKLLIPTELPRPRQAKTIDLLKELMSKNRERPVFVVGKKVCDVGRRSLYKRRQVTHPNLDKRVELPSGLRKWLKTKRKAAGLSQRVAATLAKLSQACISNWENGKSRPTLGKLKNYLDVLGIPIRELFEKGAKELPSRMELAIDYAMRFQWKGSNKSIVKQYIPIEELAPKDLHILGDVKLYSKYRGLAVPRFIKLSRELFALLGYYLAEGSLNNDYRVRFSFGLSDRSHERRCIREVVEATRRVFGIDPKVEKEKTGTNVLIDNYVVYFLFAEVFGFKGRTARSKRIPDIVFNANGDLQMEFLRAFFLGDGGVSNAGIYFTTASKELANELLYLLLQNGIVAGIGETTLGKSSFGAGNSVHNVWITNVGMLEKIEKVWRDHHLSSKIRRKMITKKNRKPRFLEKIGPCLAAVAVKSIREVKPSGRYVYDLSVEGENFICGVGGICCHNTDFDIEGSLIGRNVLKYICGDEAVERAKRMKFSTLTAEDLRRAYEQLMSRLDFELINAGIARHVLDWYWGVNVSKALSSAVEAACGRFVKLSAGRVQSPTLKILAERQREIEAFRPKPFWTVSILLELDGKGVVAEHTTSRFFEKAEAEKVLEACKDKPAEVVAIQTRQHRRPSPVPFDLGLLQSEAYRCFGYTPMRTQQIAQVLYQMALISYPRTSSQKLPSAIGYADIIRKLGEISSVYRKLANSLLELPELVPNEGKKTDPAHPCFTDDSTISLCNGVKMTVQEMEKMVQNWEYDQEKQAFVGRPEGKIKIAAYDVHTKKIERAIVTKIWKTPCKMKSILEIVLEDGRKIRTTPNHHFYTVTPNGFSFVKAGQLEVGGWLACEPEPASTVKGWIRGKGSREEHVSLCLPSFENNDRCGEERWVKIATIREVPSPEYVYDLETDNYHTFFVSGILVHNCIYPTGEKPEEELTGPQQKLYDLIVRRFFSTFAKPALVESIRVELDVGGQQFFLRGRRVLEEGWLTHYGPYATTEEILLPQLSEGQLLTVKEVKFEEKETQPPPRYNPASIVKELEARNLGTKATRGPIVQTIYDRGYIFGDQITVTELGMKVVETLDKYCPGILSEELTAYFEHEMEAIQQNKRSKEEVIREAKEHLTAILEKFKRHKVEIGKELAEAVARVRQTQRTLGPCKCGGELMLIVSRETRKRFAGCSNYPGKCGVTYPLPRVGSIVAMNKLCEQCSTPVIQVNRPGARPYRMCIDPKCPSKEKWRGKRRGI